MSRIHYPMTCCNYPFNVIWGIVKVSRATSRTFSASHTQKHGNQRNHCGGNTVWSHSEGERSRFGAVISNSVSGIQSFQRVAVRARASRSAAGARLLALNGRRRRGEARYVSLPVSLRKSPIATVLSLKSYN